MGTLKKKFISIMLVFTLLMTVFMPITASARTVAPATNDGERDMAISSDGVITWERLSIDDTCEEIYGKPVIYKLAIVSGDGAHVLEEIPNLTSTSYNLIEHMDAQRYYTNRFNFRVTTNYSTPGGGIPAYYYVSPYQKLDAPTNLRWDGNTARWNAAQNAVNYHISLYNTIGEYVEGHNTNNLYYTPSSTPLDGWYFEVYSKATGDYFDSNNSESPKKGSLGTRTVAPAINDGERDMAISSDGVITWERLSIDDTCEEIYGKPVIYKLAIVSGDGAHVLEEIPNLTSTSYNLIEHMDAQRYYTNRFNFRVTTNYSTPGGGIPAYYYVSPYQRLDAPTNLRWDGNTARWNAAQNAVNYHISLYNTIGEYVEGRNTNNLYYTPSSTPLDGWYFEVYSKATGDYFDSNENESPKKGANNVTFDLNGGTWTDAGTNSQVVYDGETAIRPTNPTKSGYVFAGWYADSACTTPFSFLTAITSNKTIYAKWNIITNSVNAILSPTPSVGLTIGDLVLTSGDSSKYSVSAGYWKLNDSGSALASTTPIEAGQTYTLYLTYYPENGYNIPDDATYTVNGIPTEWSGFEAKSNRKISFTMTQVSSGNIAGDIDCNGLVNTDDVVALLLHISVPDMFPLGSGVVADFTKDAVVSTDDAVTLLLHISMPDMFPL